MMLRVDYGSPKYGIYILLDHIKYRKGDLYYIVDRRKQIEAPSENITTEIVSRKG